MGKGSKSKKPKAQKKPLQAQHAPQRDAIRETPDFAIRPPQERAQHGTVRIPYGAGKNEAPAVVEDPDQIAHLYRTGAISYPQEQAARLFQEVYATYLADLPVSAGRSCLDIGPSGHDGGDGNVEVARRYRGMCRALGMVRESELQWVAIEDQPPRRLNVLKSALDVVEMC